MRQKLDRSKPKLLVGFVGQGVVGKHLADDFEKRGLKVVRYSLERKYRANIQKIGTCDIVFICVPTPMTPKGFDISAIEESSALVGRGKIAVVKSTVLPGTTKRLQSIFQELILLCSPEFLSAATAAHDAAKPFSNIIGLPQSSRPHAKAAQLVHGTLPKASFRQTWRSDEAELIKYAHTVHGYTQVLAFNLL
jgi:UDP-glucose 6-dehydrogenase